MSSTRKIINDLEIDNLPNRLTIFRVGMIPIVVILLFLSSDTFGFTPEKTSLFGWIAGWIFTLASITDFLDGYIARKRNIVTVFGSFLDPIADKFLTVSSLVMLQSLDRINSIVVIILVLREMYMTSLRLLANNEGVHVPVNNIGKWKTAIQMMGIPMLMVNETWQIFPFPIMGKILIYLAGFLSLWSAFQYTGNMIQKLKAKRIQTKDEISKKQSEETIEETIDEK